MRTCRLVRSPVTRQSRSAADQAAMNRAERWRRQSGEDPGMACQPGRHTSDLVACESGAYKCVGIAPVCRRARRASAGAAVATGDQNNSVRGIRSHETLDDLAGFAINCESLTGEADRGRTTRGQRGRKGQLAEEGRHPT